MQTKPIHEWPWRPLFLDNALYKVPFFCRFSKKALETVSYPHILQDKWTMALQKIKAINIASSLKIFNLSSGKSQTKEVSPLQCPIPSLPLFLWLLPAPTIIPVWIMTSHASFTSPMQSRWTPTLVWTHLFSTYSSSMRTLEHFTAFPHLSGGSAR